MIRPIVRVHGMNSRKTSLPILRTVTTAIQQRIAEMPHLKIENPEEVFVFFPADCRDDDNFHQEIIAVIIDGLGQSPGLTDHILQQLVDDLASLLVRQRPGRPVACLINATGRTDCGQVILPSKVVA